MRTIGTGFPRHLALGFYMGNSLNFKKGLAHNRSPWAKYRGDRLIIGDSNLHFRHNIFSENFLKRITQY